MRTLTGIAAASKNLVNGAEPLIVIKIAWGGTLGDIYYCDKARTIDSVTFEPRILEVSNLNIQTKQAKASAEYQSSSLASASVVLDDTLPVRSPDRKSLKDIFDSQIIENVKATVYQYFNTNLVDLITLVNGRIAGPVVWSEGDRTLRFDIVSKLDDLLVPYASDGTDVANIFHDAVNKGFPLCFGNPINVPMLKLKGAPKGTLKAPLTSETAVGAIIEINNGIDFPQATPVDVTIGNIIVNGTFAGNFFTVIELNKAKYNNVLFAARPLTDDDNDNAKVCWISDSTINLAGYNCYIATTPVGSFVKVPQINYCWKQVGKKCYFINNWLATDGNPILLSNLVNEKIDEVAVLYRNSWVPSTIIWQYGFNWQYTTHFIRWWYNAGSRVTISGIQDVYIANLIPSSSVVDVLTFKKVEGVDTEQLLSIPPQYYTINLNDSMVVNINGVATTIHPTTITFATSLSDIDSTWKDEALFVTLKSSVGKNTSDQIKYLLQNYTDLAVDAASFATVKTYLTNYPSSFAVLEPTNVLKLAEEIAFQARCGLRIDGDSVSIVYLSRKPASLKDITNDLVMLKSLYVNNSELIDVYTHITGIWRDVYMTNEMTRKRVIKTTPEVKDKLTQDDNYTIVFQNNIQKFGLRKAEFKFFIYNIKTLVEKSLQFWGHRFSNIFRKAKFTCFLNMIDYEIYDALTLQLSDTSLTGAILGIVEEQSYDPKECTIGFQLGLASLAGTQVEDASYWMSDAGDVLPADPIDLVTPSSYTDFIVTALFAPSLNDAKSGKSQGSIALGKITAVLSTTDFTIDIYDDGYGNPATETGASATLVGTESNYAVDDEVIVHINSLGNFLHASSGASNVATATVAWTQQTTLSGNPTIDNYATADDDTILLQNQTIATENGRYKILNAGWVKLDQPDACIILKGMLWSGIRFTLTGVNTYTFKLKGAYVSYSASHKNIAALTGAAPNHDGFVCPADSLLHVWCQTVAAENGLYQVKAGVWVLLGQPDKVTPQNGTILKGIDFFKQTTNVYLPKLPDYLIVDIATTATLGGTPSAYPSGLKTIDSRSFNVAGYILAKNQAGGEAPNGVYYYYNDTSTWLYLGFVRNVKVKETVTTNGLLNVGKKFFNALATTTYTKIEEGSFCTVVGLHTGAALPAALTLSDGTIISAGDRILFNGTGTRGVYICTATGAYTLDLAYGFVVVIGTRTSPTVAQCYVNNNGTYQLTYASVHS